MCSVRNVAHALACSSGIPSKVAHNLLISRGAVGHFRRSLWRVERGMAIPSKVAHNLLISRGAVGHFRRSLWRVERGMAIRAAVDVSEPPARMPALHAEACSTCDAGASDTGGRGGKPNTIS